MDALPHQTIAEAPLNHGPERVYLNFYQLVEPPFAITPDPEFLFATGSHQQAIEKITYAIENRLGFVLLTGEVGTGKTTVCRSLLDQLREKAETVYIINPSVSGQELLTGILEDAHITVDDTTSKKRLIDCLHRHLLSRNHQQPFVVIIDDAQTMPPETLEDLRLLSNLETDKHKLVQVVLSGQPELIDALGRSELRQLKQRIAIHCRLSSLSAGDADAYITQRLFVAGNQGQVRFSAKATRRIHKAARGIPRLINKICDFALIAGYVKDARVINGSHVRMALSELKSLDSGLPRHALGRFGLGAIAMGVIFLVVAAALILSGPSELPNDRSSITGAPTGYDRYREAPPAAQQSDRFIDQRLPSPEKSSGPDHPAEATPLIIPSMDREKSLNGPVVTDKTPAGLKFVSAEIVNRPPYALQLGSFSTPQNAQQSVQRYRQQGIAAHWQAVNNGQWYRVIAGEFENQTMADRYKANQGLKKALIIKAPLTIKVIPGRPTVTTTDITAFLSQIGLGCLMETDPAGDNEFYTGLFSSVEDASRMVDKINAGDRFVAQVVKR